MFLRFYHFRHAMTLRKNRLINFGLALRLYKEFAHHVT